MNRHTRQQTAAFTLVEILVALGIFMIVVAAIYSSWTAILRASKVGLDAAAQVQRERIAIRTLEEALLTTRSFAADWEHYGFVAENGGEASLSFVSRLPKSFPRNGRFGDLDVRRVTFTLEQRQEYGLNLVLRQNPILMDMDTDEKEHPIVLARNVKEFAMEFWDMQKGEWIDEWKQTNQLPKMVKVTLRTGGADPRSLGEQSEITRVVALPTIMVPAMWQAPLIPTGPAPLPGPAGGGTALPLVQPR